MFSYKWDHAQSVAQVARFFIMTCNNARPRLCPLYHLRTLSPVNIRAHLRLHSATGTRTRIARVRAEYPNQLDYGGINDLLCSDSMRCVRMHAAQYSIARCMMLLRW